MSSWRRRCHRNRDRVAGAAAGLRVVLVDPDHGDAASGVRRMLAPCSESLFGEMRCSASTCWRGQVRWFAAELEDLTGHDIGLRREGTSPSPTTTVTSALTG